MSFELERKTILPSSWNNALVADLRQHAIKTRRPFSPCHITPYLSPSLTQVGSACYWIFLFAINEMFQKNVVIKVAILSKV
jgi:hypothetical protein